MGRVFLDAFDKLVVETDNGVINPDGTASAEITSKETYTISVGDIAALLNIVNKQNIKSESSLIDDSFYYKCNILSDADMTKEITRKVDTIKALQKEIKFMRGKITGLKDKISAFNQDRKIFWRPLNIED